MTNRQTKSTWWQWLQAVWGDGNPVEILTCLEAQNPEGSTIQIDELKAPGRDRWFRVRILDGSVLRRPSGEPAQTMWPEGRFLWMREDEVKRVAMAIGGIAHRAEPGIELPASEEPPF